MSSDRHALWEAGAFCALSMIEGEGKRTSLDG